MVLADVITSRLSEWESIIDPPFATDTVTEKD